MDISLWIYSGHVSLGGDLGADPKPTGGSILPGVGTPGSPPGIGAEHERGTLKDSWATFTFPAAPNKQRPKQE